MRKRSCLNMRHLWRQVGHDIGLWDTGSSRNNGGIPAYPKLWPLISGKGQAKGGSTSFDLRDPSFWTSPCCPGREGWVCPKMGLSTNVIGLVELTSTGNPYYVVNTRTNRPFGDGLYHAFMVILGIYGIGFNTFIGGKKWVKTPWLPVDFSEFPGASPSASRPGSSAFHCECLVRSSLEAL